MKFKSTQDLSEFDEFFKQVNDLAKKAVETGYYDEAHYSGLNMATLAAIHEQGWNNLPQRDFIYSTQIRFRTDLSKLTHQMMLDIINKRGYQKGLNKIGKESVKKMQDTIDMGAFSNNKVSESWAEVKGFSEALIHYGDLVGATTYKITSDKGR